MRNMLTNWSSSGGAPAHIIAAAGSELLLTACGTMIRRDMAVTHETRWVAKDPGYHTEPVGHEACTICLAFARQWQE